MKRFAGACLLVVLGVVAAGAQRSAVQDSVFLEDLTWAEVRDRIKAGTTRVIVATAGTEQNGPHLVLGKHRYVLEYTTEQIARTLGGTLVAPIITYVPEGTWETPARGHMAKPGTITLPDDRFIELLENAARSLKAGGFRDILFLGDSGGNQNGMRDAAARLNAAWGGDGARVHFIGDYYTKAHADQQQYLIDTLKVTRRQIGSHAGIMDTSEMLFVAPQHVRMQKIAVGGGYDNSGVSAGAEPTKATAAIGRKMIEIKIANALAQIRTSLGMAAGTDSPTKLTPRLPAVREATSARRPTDTVFIEELTWEEVRDAMAAGKTGIIVPIGGTEKNGYHMVLGKHNFVVTHAANQMARKLGTALVAPTVQYVPEGNPDSQEPGEISHPSPGYDRLLDAAARSLRAHGFTDIMFIGDSGGNQAGMTNVAAALNEEWKGTDAKVYALVDYYVTGRDHYRAWLLAAFGYDDRVVGSHAGISDTSQMLFVRPAGIRKDRIAADGGGPDSGVSGDPTKATAEIGRMGIEFKVNAAIRQYRLLKNPQGRGRRGG